MTEQYQSEFTRLVEIIARLRGPDGCPWDKKQTHASLREYLMEETYEVLEALDESDSTKLRQELGDLLLQIILHAQIATEKGEFMLEDVLREINEKLIRRHPHIFSDVKVRDSEEVVRNWESIKKGERKSEASLLDSVPRAMPALAYSQDIQRRVQQVGFDWQDINGVIDKVTEEVNELKNATNQKEKSDEFGDLLFTLVNVARRLEIDPETALRQANQKFYKRFSYMEKFCRERGLELGKLSFAEQNQLWEEAKRA